MAKEKIKRKGRLSKTTGHKGLRYSKKKAAKANRHKLLTKMSEERTNERGGPLYDKKGKPKPVKFSKEFEKMARKKAVKSTAKGIAKTVLKRIGPIATVLTAAEIAKGAAKGARKVGKTLKARKDCKDKGNIYRKGFCISSKAIKSKSLRTVKK